MRICSLFLLLLSCGDGASSIGYFCLDDKDCGGGECAENMCTTACDGEDFDLTSCPENSLCHQSQCHLICEDLTEDIRPGNGEPSPAPDCPDDSISGHVDVGYMCGGPNGDYTGDFYTCSVVLGDPGG